jgi:hypothetical protein
MRRLFTAAVVSLALLGAGCASGGDKKKEGGGGEAPAATAMPCTKCKCANFTDANGDGKCDTVVDGKPCDHAKADHQAPAAPPPK